jgi:hypothetical protein
MHQIFKFILWLTAMALIAWIVQTALNTSNRGIEINLWQWANISTK